MKKTILLLLISIVITIVSACVQTSIKEAIKLDDSWQGVWEGNGLDDHNKPLTIKLSIKKDGKHLIEYPSLNCRGKLELFAITSKELKFREKFKKGTDCVSNGITVIKRKSDTELKYKWFFPNGVRGATGALTKSE